MTSVQLWSFLFALLNLTFLVNGATYTNPLKEVDGSDPHMVYTDGYYYLTTTTWTDIQLTRATTIEGLKTGEVKVVWSDTDALRCCSVWAPELHYFEGSWYIYYTAGSSDTLDNQRAHVIQGGATPWDEYAYLGQLADTWSIDGSILIIGSTRYFVWSCQADGLQSLCIATLDTPSTLGPTSVLSQPTEDWEVVGFPVNEGAVAMYHGGQTFLTYSASDCWTDSYSLGLLTYDGSGDPLDAASWAKTGPVFTSANGNYGTGHNGFFTSPDETEIWNVFHATAIAEGACDGNRYTMLTIVNWNEDGTPNFGEAPTFDTVMEGPSGE
ncbi:hypothetical protein FQN54_004605 [Arachnomyces sp. PD_36]|nr:hypothetical protein FQN54_004605 [Arachnomyces sp. PD_36]